MTHGTNRQNRLCRTAITVADGERVRASVPPPLPPDPPVQLRRLVNPLDAADLALGRLDGMAAVRDAAGDLAEALADRESVLSAQLAGCDVGLADLYAGRGAAPGRGGSDGASVAAGYRRALDHGWTRVGAGAALSPGVLGELHVRLTASGEGGDAAGELRATQIWAGAAAASEAAFVPAPPGQLPALMADWERFVHHDTSGLPPLIRAGLAHAQLTTIQPFPDANQRLARLTIPLMLQSAGVLCAPLLSPSAFFVRQPGLYAAHLAAVRSRGAWEEWLEFFIQGIAESAREAAGLVQRALALFSRDAARIEQTDPDLEPLHAHLRRHPVTAVSQVASVLDTPAASARAALDRLAAIGVVQPWGQDHDEPWFAYMDYLALLNRASEPVPA